MTNLQIAGCVGIIKAHSKEEQELKAVEECAELASAVLHYQAGKATIHEVIDEIADVQIMCEQLMILHDCREAVEKRISQKLDRQLGRDKG